MEMPWISDDDDDMDGRTELGTEVRLRWWARARLGRNTRQ
jgi:hypothetical protein